MTDSLAMRGANAATGFVLSSLLVCGVIVVSEPGTYALPAGSQNAPLAEGAQPGALGDPGANAPRPSTSQSITVPVTLRAPRDANARGAAMALPTSAMSAAARPDQGPTTNRSGAPKSRQGSFTGDVSKDRQGRGERGSRTSSRRGATSSARDTSQTRDPSDSRDTSQTRATSDSRDTFQRRDTSKEPGTSKERDTSRGRETRTFRSSSSRAESGKGA